jgi:hypothetical protein
MMKNRLTDQTGNDVDVNVDALLAAINEISESEVHRILDDPQRASIDGRGRIPGANWRRHLNSIFMISAPVKPTASDGRKNPDSQESGSNLLMQEALENSLHREIRCVETLSSIILHDKRYS